LLTKFVTITDIVETWLNYSTRNALSVSSFYLIKLLEMATSQRHLVSTLKILSAEPNIHRNRLKVNVF